MVKMETLLSVGFTRKQAEELLRDPYFSKYVKSDEKFLRKFETMLEIYGEENRPRILKAILDWPQFAGYDHARVIKDVTSTYGIPKSKAVEIILNYPPFAGLDHARVIKDVTRIYGISRAKAIEIILKHPKFAGEDHERKLQEIMRVYGVSRAKAIEAVLKEPRFIGRDHARVLRDAVEVLGIKHKARIIEMIISYPQAAGYDLKKRLRRTMLVAGKAGLTREEVIEFILKSKSYIGHSPKRTVAIADVMREIKREILEKHPGIRENVLNEILDKAAMERYRSSPYVEVVTPDGKRLKVRLTIAKRLVEKRGAKIVKKPTFYEAARKRVFQMLRGRRLI